MKEYDENELLSLSGIQHFAFCQRQWALIHIEQQWAENLKTTLGKQLHERVDNPNFFESRGDILISRSLPLVSYALGFYGIADVVEFHATDSGIMLNGRKEIYQPIPIEYKRGKPKEDEIDKVQLCLQAMCIEEMLMTKIDYGYFYYGETKHRYKVVLDENLRETVTSYAQEMHKMYEQKYTPKPKVKSKNKACKSCSLIDICMPSLNIAKQSVRKYIESYIDEVENEKIT